MFGSKPAFMADYRSLGEELWKMIRGQKDLSFFTKYGTNPSISNGGTHH